MVGLAGLIGLGGFPPIPTTDEFGIPYPLGTLLTPETDEQRAARETAARGVIQRVFIAAVRNLGEDEARRIWAEAAKKKRGAPRGPRNPEKDQRLLQVYDDVIARGDIIPPESLPRRLAEAALGSDGGIFGNSVAAIEKHIRRLLARREKQRAQERDLMAKFLMYGGSPTSLLGGAVPPDLLPPY